MFIYIAGVSGVGKTTLCRELANRPGITAYGGTAQLMAYHGLTDYDYFQRHCLTYIEQWMYQYEKDLHAIDCGAPHHLRVLDCHFCYAKYDQFVRRQANAWDRQNLQAVVLLESPAEVVLARREQEKISRYERRIDLAAIVHEQQQEMIACLEWCDTIGIVPIVINNEELTLTVSTILSLLPPRRETRTYEGRA